MSSELEKLKSDLAYITGVIGLVEYLTTNALGIHWMDPNSDDFNVVCNLHAPERVGMIERRDEINSKISQLNVHNEKDLK